MADLQGFSGDRLRKLSQSVSNVVASVHDFRVMSKHVAKIVVSLTTDRCSAEEVAHAISRSVGNGFTPVLGSFRRIPGSRCLAVAGFVAKAPEVMLQSDERYKGLTSVTASIMLDPADSSLWDVCSDASGSFLVRAGKEDLTELLVTAKVRNTSAPRMHELASCSAAGEFVSFVNANTGLLAHGFVLASDGDTVSVLTEGEEPIDTSEDSIVEAAVLHGSDVEVAAKVGITASEYDSRSKAAMTEYYGKLYSYAPAYVEMLTTQINNHAEV